MPREGQIICYTGEEAMTIRLLELEKDAFSEAFHVLRDRYCSDPETAEVHRLFDTMERTMQAALVEQCHVVHARLCRVFPQLADVIALCCFPEWMPTPTFVEPNGMPETWTIPGPWRTSREED